MATTTPDSIYYPLGTDAVAPLNTVFATQATSVQAALNARQRKSYRWTNTAARTAQVGMVAGDTGYQIDTKAEYLYDGTGWVPVLNPVYGSMSFISVFVPDSTRTPRAARQTGRVFLEGAVRSTNATFVAGTVYTVGSIPAAFAPKIAKAFAIDLNRVHGYVVVDASGSVGIMSTVGFTGVLDASIDGLNWVDKAIA